MNRAILDWMLGFTGGVMVAASFWSLLSPAIEMTKGNGFEKVFPAAIGFGLGAIFLFSLDKVLPHVHINFKETEGIKTPWYRSCKNPSNKNNYSPRLIWIKTSSR